MKLNNFIQRPQNSSASRCPVSPGNLENDILQGSLPHISPRNFPCPIHPYSDAAVARESHRLNMT